MTKKERALIALKAHEQGLNCAQCMLLSFADVTGLSEPQSCGIATGFGGGGWFLLLFQLRQIIAEHIHGGNDEDGTVAGNAQFPGKVGGLQVMVL